MATQHNVRKDDPFAKPMLFFRIGWMSHYEGQLNTDPITSGGSYITKHGYGHEIMNFKPFRGRVYGFGQPRGKQIAIERIGQPKNDAMTGVLVVWVATPTEGGTVIIGWYKNATVYRNVQELPRGSHRKYKGESLGYFVSAKKENAHLLPNDERVFSVSRQTGGMGQANVWYVDDEKTHREFRHKVLSYINTGQLPKRPRLKKTGRPRHPDPLTRKRIEQIAIRQVTRRFERYGYTVDSVERDNVGWDLNARNGKRYVRLEVKGLSGTDVQIELTPNEYANMKAHRDSYRICVVTNALSSPQMTIFAFSLDTGNWEDQKRRILKIDERVGARCHLG
jgi:hypothetical protein